MKLIKGFERYAIFEDGKVINVETGKIKATTDNHAGNGYLYVDLYCNGIHKKLYVHRLVAEAYVPNPDNKPYVNHIDGNTKNNTISNLEWCTPLENVTHAAKVLGVMKQYQKASFAQKKKVICKDFKSGKLVKTYNSINEAARETGIPTSNIVAQLKGRQTYTKGLTWCYVEEL